MYNRSGPVAKCLPGTRQNIITVIKNWADEDGDHPICWLNGPAGFGKSAIAQTIAEFYAAERRLAGSFFFRRGEGPRSKIARLIPTLSHQLALAFPAMEPSIQFAIKKEPYIASERQSLEYQFQKLMIDPMVSASAAIGLTKPVIVIDGLDECDDKELMEEFIDV